MLLITAVHCRVPEHITHISVGATRSMQTRWGKKKALPLLLLLLRVLERRSRIRRRCIGMLRTSNFGAETAALRPEHN